MKALIPVAGIGAKLRPHTYTQTRALVPIAGKPILAHIVDTLISGGIKEYVFITGYLGSKTEMFLKQHYRDSDISISFVRQEPREGIGHALWCAREHLKENEEVVIMLGDTILNLDLKQFLQQPHSVLGTHRVDTPGNFGVVEVNGEGFVTKLVEKPKIPKSNLAMVGIYKIANPMLLKEGIAYITSNQVKTHGEYQLTDILTYMIEHGEPIKTFNVDNWYDCGKKESLLEANAILLGKPEFKQKLQKRFPGTVIIPPVSFGEGCAINNAIIGPNVAIGDNTTITYSIVKNSIIGSYTNVKSSVLNNSVIGSDTTLKGLSQSLNIGDNAEINFYDK